MKKLFLLIAIVFGITTISMAQAKPGEFKFDSEVHDFGNIVLGKPVVHTFNFTNIGEAPIIITKVETTCGCTVPEYTKLPIKKGEKGFIKVTLTPAGPAVPIVKSITLTSNARTTTKVLLIKGVYVEGNTK
ncbi:DUF1573 domain-containing protein [Pedobacter insulae]|uniref:DUF1573 domain-containing protein n=1 Tax=Pedobacter insulae TaxID=414048 RepID=A0A1I2YK31_9SPHI|nr:DUF1573 domain-containing protein [Pedobacter insulae]SFH25709.1 Protein of unknown function [Pedobacter insulae]